MLSLSVIKSKIASFHVTFTTLCQCNLKFSKNSTRISTRFPNNSQKIKKIFAKNLENFQRIPLEITKTFSLTLIGQKIPNQNPTMQPQTISKEVPQNSQRFPKKTPQIPPMIIKLFCIDMKIKTKTI